MACERQTHAHDLLKENMFAVGSGRELEGLNGKAGQGRINGKGEGRSVISCA